MGVCRHFAFNGDKALFGLQEQIDLSAVQRPEMIEIDRQIGRFDLFENF
jgi:hypothetical protein